MFGRKLTILLVWWCWYVNGLCLPQLLLIYSTKLFCCCSFSRLVSIFLIEVDCYAPKKLSNRIYNLKFMNFMNIFWSTCHSALFINDREKKINANIAKPIKCQFSELDIGQKVMMMMIILDYSVEVGRAFIQIIYRCNAFAIIVQCAIWIALTFS